MASKEVEEILQKLESKIKTIDKKVKLEEQWYNREVEKLKKAHDSEREKLEEVYLSKGDKIRVKEKVNEERVDRLDDLKTIKKGGFFGSIKSMFSKKKLDNVPEPSKLDLQLDQLDLALEKGLTYLEDKKDEELDGLMRERTSLIEERKKFLEEYEGLTRGRLDDLKKKIDLLEQKKEAISLSGKRKDVVDKLNTEIRKRNRFLKECYAIFEKQKKTMENEGLGLVDFKNKLNQKELKEKLAVAKKDLEINKSKGKVYSRRIMKQIRSTEKVLDGLEQRSFRELIK